MRSRHQIEKWLAREILGRTIPRKPPEQARRTSAARDPEYLAWIRQQPSVISGRHGCEAAHTGSDGGMAMKASDTSCIPLTPEEHREYHQIGRPAFERKYKLDCARVAARLYARYCQLRQSA